MLHRGVQKALEQPCGCEGQSGGRAQAGFPDGDQHLSRTLTAEWAVRRHEAREEGKARVVWKKSPLGVGLAWPSPLR